MDGNECRLAAKKLQMNGILHNTTFCGVNGVKSVSNFGRMRFASHIWVCICPRRTYLKSLPSSDAHSILLGVHHLISLCIQYFHSDISLVSWIFSDAKYFTTLNTRLVGSSCSVYFFKSFQAKEACTWCVEVGKKQTVLRSTSNTSSCLKSKQYQNNSM